jgi:hypothetical protein
MSHFSDWHFVPTRLSGGLWANVAVTYYFKIIFAERSKPGL